MCGDADRLRGRSWSVPIDGLSSNSILCELIESFHFVVLSVHLHTLHTVGHSQSEIIKQSDTGRHIVKQRYLIRQTVRHSETVGHSHTQPDIVRHTQTVRHRETVGRSQIHSNTVRKTQHTKHTHKKENTRLWFDLLFSRWALAPQQPVAQYRTVGLTGLIPAHLDGGGRQSLGPEGLHPAGNLDCENTETQQVLDFLDY